MVSGVQTAMLPGTSGSCTYGYERIAARAARTTPSAARAWAARTGEAVHALALASYDRMTGLDLHDLAGQGVNRSGQSQQPEGN